MAQDPEVDAFKFDVACALGVLANPTKLPFDLPSTLEIPPEAQQLLDTCLDLSSLTRSSCKIKSDLPAGQYTLAVGADELRLKPGGSILGGGSGVTIQLHDTGTNRSYALKVPRLSVLAYDRQTRKLGEHLDRIFAVEMTAFENERQRSRRLAHQNIAQHLFGSTRQIQRPGIILVLPFSLAEWIPGALALHKFLLKSQPSTSLVLSLISQTLYAIEYLRTQGIVHWDLKSDNIIVGDDQIVRLIDFGNAKSVESLDPVTDLIAITTEGKYPLHAGFTVEDNALQGSRRFEITLPHISWNDHFIDLWMLAQEWNRCLSIAPAYLEDATNDLVPVRVELGPRVQHAENTREEGFADCLALVFSRILAPLSATRATRARKRDKSFDKSSIYYLTAADVLAELQRISPLLGAGQNVPELLVSLGDIVRLPVTGNSVFTDRVARLVNTPMARRTKLHLQLAQVREVYPGATHSRFEHLLGTVTTASYVLRSLYLNEASGFWRVSASESDIKSVVLAALLHDVGHLSFGHFLEEMKDLFSGVGHVDFVRAFLRRCIGEPLSPDDEHFVLDDGEVSAFVELLTADWCGRRSEVKPLVRKVLQNLESSQITSNFDILSKEGTRAALDSLMRSMVSGPLDADKVDYLRRDSAHAGVMFAAGIDIERFFESLRVCISDEPDTQIATLGVSEKGLAAVETVITARYHLFSVVYWHRTVRCITAILQRLISEIFGVSSEAEWTAFKRALLFEFRTRDDRQAIAWLRSEVERLSFESMTVEPKWRGSSGSQRARTCLGDLLDALDGDRDQYFEMAFELSYSGVIGPAGSHSSTPSAELHRKFAERFYGSLNEDTVSYDQTKHLREGIGAVRWDLQERFNDAINRIPQVRAALRDRLFMIDTILIDVPESGKDQLEGLHVDRRSKRTRRNITLVESEDWYVPASPIDDITDASPIAAALRDVFNHWARRLRIFMTNRDLATLGGYGLTPGDISAIWEKVLYDYFGLKPGKQYLMSDLLS